MPRMLLQWRATRLTDCCDGRRLDPGVEREPARGRPLLVSQPEQGTQQTVEGEVALGTSPEVDCTAAAFAAGREYLDCKLLGCIFHIYHPHHHHSHHSVVILAQAIFPRGWLSCFAFVCKTSSVI